MNLEIPFTPIEEARLTAAAKQTGLAPAELIKRLALAHLPPVPANAEDELDAKLRFWQEQDDVTLYPDRTAQELFAQWAEEDAHMTPEQQAENERIYAEIEQNGIPSADISHAAHNRFKLFPVSCIGKNRGNPPSITDTCRQWVMDCIAAGNSVRVPAIAYYETLRELGRLNAAAQIARLKVFCFTDPYRFLPLETVHLEEAARLWAQSRNIGLPTSRPEALDGDVILAAQALSLGVAATQLIVATTNPAHLSRFVAADLWTNIQS